MTTKAPTSKRPTWREVSLSPLRYRVERARADYGRPVWLAYRASDLEDAQFFRTHRGAIRYALERVTTAMTMTSTLGLVLSIDEE